MLEAIDETHYCYLIIDYCGPEYVGGNGGRFGSDTRNCESNGRARYAQVQLLVDYFFAAARTGDITVLEHFLDAGFPIDQRNSQTYTALMVAAYNGQEAATDLLLEHGANACLQDKRGNTAMMGAVIKAEFTIVKRLYAKECDANLTNNAGMTLTEFARYWGQSGALQQASLK